MNFDFAKARNLMVENQLRPNKIKNPIILNLFKHTKKEDFLSDNVKLTAYSDLDIDLDLHRGYLKNLHIAQLIHSSDIKKDQKVLHIGGLTGYVSSMIASLCKELIVIENKINLTHLLKKNIKNLNINNIKIVSTKFNDGFFEESPYDLIFIDNPVHKITNHLKNQITFISGKIVMIKKINHSLSKAYKIIKNNNSYNEEFLFDVFTSYELYKNENKFVF